MATVPRPCVLCLAALLPFWAGAALAAEPLTLDTPAQAYVRKLPVEKPADPAKKNLAPSPSDSVMQPKRRGTKLLSETPETAQRIDEIVIYSYRDPADYITPEKAPLLQMRDQLDRVHRATPAERAHSLLCMLGLCGGIPTEVPLEDRKDTRLQRTTLELSLDQAGRGPLQ